MPAVDLTTLPPLPDGWYYEDGDARNQIVYIVWPKHGAVSVSLEYRSFALGFSRPNRPGRDAKSYAGKGWKEAIVGDAVKVLRAAWE